MPMPKRKEIRLTRAEWVEIEAALALKAYKLEVDTYAPCMEHRRRCGCNARWAKDLRRIQKTIGPDGIHAATLGVQPARD